MALREAVTNVVRHAGARRATISIAAEGPDVRLEVSDDGRGYTGLAGAGISGMRERIAALGGLVDVSSPAGGDDRHGTVVEVTVPREGTADDARRAEEVEG